MPDKLGQDDIDRMLAELGADGGKPSAPETGSPAPAAASPAPAAPAQPAGPLGQDDIDAMLAAMGAGDAPAAAAPAPAPAAASPSSPAEAAAPTPERPAPPSGHGTSDATAQLGRDDIDKLLERASEVVTGTHTKPTAAGPGSGHLDQTEIDKLLADLDPHSRARTASASSSGGHLSQESIDNLLSELDVAPGSSSEVTASAAPAKPATAAARAPAQAAPAAPPAAPAAPPAAPAPAAGSTGDKPEGPLSQDDIDALLAQLGAPSTSIQAGKAASKPGATTVDAAPPPSGEVPSRRKVPPAPEPVVSASRAADATQALSPEEIDRIVAKQATGDAPSDSEAEIAQSDIDALVKQLAQATGAPEAQEVADAIVGKAADIDRMQEEASQPSPELTRDAVDVNSVLGRTASTTSVHAMPGSLAVATVATVEWRAAKWLLAAAVLLLGLCSGALIVLTASVGSLTGELRAARAVEQPAADGYAERLRLALAKLEERDEAERARGVRWMEDLKRQHPERGADIAIALARHFRSRQAWRRASEEFGAAIEAGGSADDPRVLLEQADCLARIDDLGGAIRTVYSLLAGESRWLAERDAAGRANPHLERNRQAVADAYLVLGRLLSRRQGDALAVTAAKPAEPGPAPGGGGH